MSIGKHVRLGGLLVAAIALGVVVTFALGYSQAGTSQAAAHGAIAMDCDATQGGVQSDCTYAPGSSFDIEIHVTAVPEGGYFIFQVMTAWTEGVLNYLPTADPGDEALWAPCTLAARTNNWKQVGDPSVFFSCTPFPFLTVGDTTAGAILTFEFQCKTEFVPPPNGMSPPNGTGGNQSVLQLVPTSPQGDTVFGDVDLQPIIPALTDASVTCGDVPPPPPPEPTATPGEPAATPTLALPGVGPGPTATPLPTGPTPGTEGELSLTAGDAEIAVGEDTVLTFTVKDNAGNTVEGVDCTFSIVGPEGTDATLSSETGTTDANGDVSVTLTGGTTAETVQVKADCGEEFGSFVQNVTVLPTALPTTGAALEADRGFGVGLWAMIGTLLVAAAAGLTVFGWRSTRAR